MKQKSFYSFDAPDRKKNIRATRVIPNTVHTVFDTPRTSNCIAPAICWMQTFIKNAFDSQKLPWCLHTKASKFVRYSNFSRKIYSDFYAQASKCVRYRNFGEKIYENMDTNVTHLNYLNHSTLYVVWNSSTIWYRFKEACSVLWQVYICNWKRLIHANDSPPNLRPGTCFLPALAWFEVRYFFETPAQ